MRSSLEEGRDLVYGLKGANSILESCSQSPLVPCCARKVEEFLLMGARTRPADRLCHVHTLNGSVDADPVRTDEDVELLLSADAC